MTTYYRITDGRSDIVLTTGQYNALAPNKRGALRVFVVDEKPAVEATQIAYRNGISVGETEAHLTWAVRDKTADELAADDLATEGSQSDQMIADILTQIAIDNAAYNAMTDNQKFATLRVDRRVLLRACRYLLRRTRSLL